MPKRHSGIFAAEVGAHNQLRTTLSPETQVYQAIRSPLDETMIDVLARNLSFRPSMPPVWSAGF
jgi:hypothetical protein